MDLKNKRILITGGLGFIGSALANKLIKDGCNINIISRSTHNIWRIEDKTQIRLYKIGLEKNSKLVKCIKKIEPEVIFHLAGNVNPVRDFNLIDKAFLIHFYATKNLIQALNDIDYELLINTGTSDEYGFLKAPFKETDRGIPISPYSASKLGTTQFCEMISNIFEKPIITVRPFLIYGPKQISKSLIPWLIYSGIEKISLKLTPCEQTRDLIFINDLVDAYILLAENANMVKKMGIFNIGSGIETQIINIVNMIRNKIRDTHFLVGERPYRVGENMHHFSSINKIKNILGWTPKWTLDEGINNTIKWWQRNRSIWISKKDLWD